MPDVSIIVPVHNDEDWVGYAIESCLAQTLESIEVICVDDASTDRTCQVIEEFEQRDPRVRLVRQENNLSALQARRAGVEAANAPFVLFLDGDDELAPEAARLALETARTEEADVVRFGIEVIRHDGRPGGRFQASLQPFPRPLEGDEIVPGLFPPGRAVHGQIWGYLWSIDLLRGAYADLPDDLALYRANDIPISYLSVAAAKKYASTPELLYRYFWRRGASGHPIVDVPSFEFYLGAMDSIDAIADGVRARAERRDDPASLLASYDSARMSIINSIIRYVVPIDDADLQAQCVSLLKARAGEVEVVRAAATFALDFLPLLAKHKPELPTIAERPVRSVLLTATNLASGGIQGVVVSQAKALVGAGFNVVIGVRMVDERVHELPEGVQLVQITGGSVAEKISTYMEILRDHAIDVVIDHWILYREDWPFYALAAASVGVRTIGWLHSFSLRSAYDANTRGSFHAQYLPVLSQVMVSSPTDVAFWKLRGIRDVAYLPNPPSPWLLDRAHRSTPRPAPEGPLRLIWWGRLDQKTKQVTDQIKVAAVLRELGVDFRLTIIGPDSPDLKAESLLDLAARYGVEDAVTTVDAMHGDELMEALEDSDICLFTSGIEGYPLALIEAQSLGLPVAMYELPWLAVVKGNEGLLTAPQRDSRALALQIARISGDADAYTRLSAGSIAAARAALSHDFASLSAMLVRGELPAEYAPTPSIEDAKLLLDLALTYSERNTRRAQHAHALNLQKMKRERQKVKELRARILDLTDLVREQRQKTRAARDKTEAAGKRRAELAKRNAELTTMVKRLRAEATPRFQLQRVVRGAVRRAKRLVSPSR